MSVKEHPGHVVRRTVIGRLTVPGIPLRWIANFLPPEIMKLYIN